MENTSSARPAATAPWAALGVSTVANLAIQLDAIGMFAVYPELLRVFAGTSEATLSWVLNAYTIAFAALLVPAGRLADRFGRRQLFLVGSVLYGVAAGLGGVAPNPELLIAARVVQGLGAALLIPTSLALVLVAFPPARRAGAVNQWVAGGAIGGTIAPTLGGLIVATVGWRWFFALSLLLGSLAFALGRRFLGKSARDEREPLPDTVGLVLLTAGLSLLALGIVRGDGLAVAGIGRQATVALGAVLLAGFGLRSVRVPHPAVDLALLSHPVRALSGLAMLLFGISFSAMFLAFNLFLTRQWHLTSFEAGLAITLGPAASMLAAQLARRLADRWGHRALLLPGSIAYALSGVLLVLAAAGPRDPFAYWLPAMVVGGIGVGLSMSALSGLTVFGLAQGRFAVGAGVSQATRQLGGVVGVSFSTALLQATDPATAYTVIFAAVTGAGLSLAALAVPILRRSRPGVADDGRGTKLVSAVVSSTPAGCAVRADGRAGDVEV